MFSEVNINNLLSHSKIAIIGLGYVGMPLAVEFSKKYKVLGFDINKKRVEELSCGVDHTQEVNTIDLQKSLQNGLLFTADLNDLRSSNIFIVTVPTPIDSFKLPDLSFLKKASEMVGSIIKFGDIVIYESTVYPGCTEEECIPILEKTSDLAFNRDFFVGYSPERINPGDKVNILSQIKKVTSGSTPEIATKIDKLYNSIISAGTHKAPSIKVAEASKAIENAQRDLNISFVNELALIFDRLGIDTNDVIEAAGTKWNFLKFKPGLVGGHCIGVDPYYLTYKAQSVGYHPEVILSGRRVNDNMGSFIANKVIKLMIQKEIAIKNSNVLILGITFKENCPDIRNTRVVDIYQELTSFGMMVDVFDPWANPSEVNKIYGLKCSSTMDDIHNKEFDVIILAVAHSEFKSLDFSLLKKSLNVTFDIKGFLDKKLVDARL